MITRNERIPAPPAWSRVAGPEKPPIDDPLAAERESNGTDGADVEPEKMTDAEEPDW